MTTRVYFRHSHPHGVLFAAAYSQRQNLGDVTYHNISSISVLPDPLQCTGKHVVIEHFLPAQAYVSMLANCCKSVTLYPDSPVGYAIPANVFIKYSSQPAYLRAFEENGEYPSWVEDRNVGPESGLGLWLWMQVQDGLSLRLPYPKVFETMLEDGSSGDMHDIAEDLTEFSDALLEDQMNGCEILHIAGIQGKGINVPNVLTERALTMFPDEQLLLVYSIRKGSAQGYFRIRTDMHGALSAELANAFSISVFPVPRTNRIRFKTTMAKLSRLFAKGYTALHE